MADRATGGRLGGAATEDSDPDPANPSGIE
jgi:hypothetical protein